MAVQNGVHNRVLAQNACAGLLCYWERLQNHLQHLSPAFHCVHVTWGAGLGRALRRRGLLRLLLRGRPRWGASVELGGRSNGQLLGVGQFAYLGSF